MKIGVDIDGVLTAEHEFIIETGTKFFYENNIPYVVHNDIYDSPEIFGVSKNNYDLFWKKYFFEYAVNVSPRGYAAEVLEKLKQEGNEIIIITARPFTTYENEYTEQMKILAIDWLSKNKIPYDKIIFSDKKAQDCQKLGIDIMIEDKPDNILSVSEVIPVICYENPFNKNISKDNIYRCYSWYDIYNLINSIK